LRGAGIVIAKGVAGEEPRGADDEEERHRGRRFVIVVGLRRARRRQRDAAAQRDTGDERLDLVVVAGGDGRRLRAKF